MVGLACHDCDTNTVTVVNVATITQATHEATRRERSELGAADLGGHHQTRRDERAQRPLLHDQVTGAAADPSWAQRLLHLGARRPPRAGPGAAGPRVHPR